MANKHNWDPSPDCITKPIFLTILRLGRRKQEQKKRDKLTEHKYKNGYLIARSYIELYRQFCGIDHIPFPIRKEDTQAWKGN